MKFSGIFCFLIITILFKVVPASGQDTIFLVNKKKILAKVLIVDPKVVKYKKFGEPEGYTYRIDRRDLVKIVYQNGVADTFNVRLALIPEPPYIPPPPESDPIALDYFHNYAFITATDLFMGVLTVGYERIFKSGKAGLQVPVSVGLSTVGVLKKSYDNHSPLSPAMPSGAHYFKNKIFATGLELNSYPKGQRTVSYFWGPSIDFGWYNYYSYKSIPDQPGNFSIEKMTSPVLTIMLKNGVSVQPSKKFGLSAFLGLGTKNLVEEPQSKSSSNYFYSYTVWKHFNVELGINAGIKF